MQAHLMEGEERSSSNNSTKVCITGGAGYIGSWLVKKLLLKGYIVHATLRDLSDAFKVGLLRALPHAEERLRFFEADIYDPDAFQPAIDGCEYIFHVATPMHHNENSQFKDITEAALAGAKSILGSCAKAGTVKKFIYTATVMSASPLKEGGTGFKDYIDESCWTPLDHSFAYSDNFTSGYISSKTLVEKEMLGYNNKEKFGFNVVTLVCGLVGGDTLLPYISGSQQTIISQLSNNALFHKHLTLLQEMWGAVPLAHIDDVCEAHIFCMEKPLMNGRFLCVQGYQTLTQFADYYKESYPEFRVEEEVTEEQESGTRGSSSKLTDLGFEYKYDVRKMLKETVDCARRLGSLQ